MLINLSKLLSGDQEKLIEQVTLEMDAFACSLGTFPVTKKQSFPLTITKIGTDKFLFEGETVVTMEVPCDRCLSPVTVEVPLEICREYDKDDAEESEEDPEPEMPFRFSIKSSMLKSLPLPRPPPKLMLSGLYNSPWSLP